MKTFELKSLQMIRHWEEMERNYGFTRYSLKDFEEAIEELEALQSRSCKWCKYFGKKSECENDAMWFIKEFSVEMPNDFCCNRYEANEQ